MSKLQTTRYPGVNERTKKVGGKTVKVYYIRYRLKGKEYTECTDWREIDTAAKASHLRHEKMKGKIPPKSHKGDIVTFDMLLEKYVEVKTGDIKPRSIRHMVYDYTKYIKPIFGSKAPADLVKLDLHRFIKMLRKHDLKETTIEEYVYKLKRLVNFGVEYNLCDPLKFKLPKLKNVKREKTEFLTEDELKRLLAVLGEYPNRSIANALKLALATGMRKNEILGLKPADIDFENGFITVQDTKNYQPLKVPMNQVAESILKERVRSCESGWLFPNVKGEYMANPYWHGYKIKELAKLPKDFRVFHGLRHTYASMLASSGKVDLYTISKLLNHTTVNMTKRYAHLRDSALRDATQVMNGVFEA